MEGFKPRVLEHQTLTCAEVSKPSCTSALPGELLKTHIPIPFLGSGHIGITQGRAAHWHFITNRPTTCFSCSQAGPSVALISPLKPEGAAGLPSRLLVSVPSAVVMDRFSFAAVVTCLIPSVSYVNIKLG